MNRRAGSGRSLRGLLLPGLRHGVGLAIVTLLATAATFGFRSLTGDWSLVAPAVVGAVAAAVVVEAGRRFGLLAGETLAISVLAFVLVGTVMVGGIPGPAAFGTFFDGLTGSWANVLSSVTPIEVTAELRVAPFALAWLGATVGVGLLGWGRPPGIPIIGPIVALVVTVLLTEEDRSLSIVIGTAMAVGAIGLGLLQHRRAGDRSGTPAAAGDRFGAPDDDADVTAGGTVVPRRMRLARTTAALAVVAVAAPWVGPRLPLAESRDRFDLRDQLVPPWDPLAVPSPLVQIKASLADEREDDVVFRVDSDTPIERWTLASMGTYDGTVWTVASPGGVAEREFHPVGPRLPAPDVQPIADDVSATVTLVDVPGPWLPSPGWPTAVRFDEPHPSPIVRENIRTGTLAVAEGVAAGASYRIEALPHPEPGDAALLDASVPRIAASVDLDVLPPQIRNLTADITQGIDRGWGQAAALRDQFAENGFYDKSTTAIPGHSYYRLALFLGEPDRIVGYEEQYAATAALMARIVGLPSRVTVGYLVPADRYVDGSAEVLAGDMSAWLEVLVDDIGWVPVDVTPPRTREPESEVAIAPREQVATPNPPPPPQVPPDVDVVTDNRDVEDLVEEEDEEEDEEDDEDDSDDDPAGGFGWGIWVLLGVGVLGLLLIGAAALVIAAKALRTRRRRTAPQPPTRIAGAWHELGDRYREAGLTPTTQATPLEIARSVLTVDPSIGPAAPELLSLVSSVDRAAYHAVPPADHDAERAWTCYDAVLAAMLRARTPTRRARMKLDPRPLFRRAPGTTPSSHHD